MQVLVDRSTTDGTYKSAKKLKTDLNLGGKMHLNVSQKPGLPSVYAELIDRAEPADGLCGFLDADDRLMPVAVRTIQKAYQADPTLGHVWSQFMFHPRGQQGWSRYPPRRMSLAEALISGWWGAQHWRTFRKEAYETSPYKLQPDVAFATDFNLATVLAASGCGYRHIPDSLYVYYQHVGSISAEHRKRQRADWNTLRKRFGHWHKQAQA